MEALISPAVQELWIGGGVAFLAVLGLTPLVIRLARGWGWVDHPTEDRWHDRPVALMGGIALVGAVILGVLASRAPVLEAWPVQLGAVLMFVVGVLDDRWDLHPDGKVLAQVLAAALLLYAGYAFWRGGAAWVSMPLTFLWVIGVTNAINLIDGMDGLAGGLAAIAASVIGVIAWMIGLTEVAIVAAAVAGAGAGFLLFNFQPARIFMGDCGSLFLGYMLAVVALGVQSVLAGFFLAILAGALVAAAQLRVEPAREPAVHLILQKQFCGLTFGSSCIKVFQSVTVDIGNCYCRALLRYHMRYKRFPVELYKIIFLVPVI